jgi:outer membrane protein OmpA-like peptidoglycan-associated protein
MQNIIIFITLVLFHINLLAQNLVINGNFEDTISDFNPIKQRNYLWKAYKWKEINSANYYWYGNMDGIHNNKIKTTAHTGFCYAGIYVNIENVQNREFIIGELKSQLIKGHDYKIKIAIKEINKKSSPNYIEVFFSNKLKRFSNENVIVLNKRINIEDNWSIYETNYKSSCDEKYIAIGYFNEIIKLKRKNKEGFYIFIDDVVVEPERIYNTYSTTENSVNIGNPFIDTTINVYFQSNSSLIESDNALILDKIVNRFNKDDFFIEISRFIDNTRNNSYNKTLLHNRSEAIYNYLINNGMSKNKISFSGKGVYKNDNLSDDKLSKVVIYIKYI